MEWYVVGISSEEIRIVKGKGFVGYLYGLVMFGFCWIFVGRGLFIFNSYFRFRREFVEREGRKEWRFFFLLKSFLKRFGFMFFYIFLISALNVLVKLVGLRIEGGKVV